ncbi:hypothetical protein T492DRAFT_832864 [Pavlovales sp. CCMP2436]|nr:hypothetical protein T492DRAFT_832864 [Pavlovales sp. CCMP2436]
MAIYDSTTRDYILRPFVKELLGNFVQLGIELHVRTHAEHNFAMRELGKNGLLSYFTSVVARPRLSLEVPPGFKSIDEIKLNREFFIFNDRSDVWWAQRLHAL